MNSIVTIDPNFSIVNKLFAELLGETATTVSVLTTGAVNTVFKVVTESAKSYVLRAYHSATWPEVGKLSWISEQLESRDIPTAKVIYESRDTTYFEHGFVVQEYISGPLVSHAIESQLIDEPNYFEKLGETLRRVHEIRVDRFASVILKNESQQSYELYINADIARCKKYLKHVDEQIFTFLSNNALYELLHRDSHLISNESLVLSHADLNQNNVILTDDQELVLIDWDNAIGHHWAFDIAHISFAYKYKHFHEPKKMTQWRERLGLLLLAYGKSASINEYSKIEPILHRQFCLGKGSYYKHRNGGQEYFERIEAYLENLLHE